jgi:hypothetical protein
MATLKAPALQDILAVRSAHALAEAMNALVPPIMGLVRSLHGFSGSLRIFPLL